MSIYERPRIFIVKGSLCAELEQYGTCRFSSDQAKLATSIAKKLNKRLHEVEPCVLYFSNTNLKF
jgi:hypothetical protein